MNVATFFFFLWLLLHGNPSFGLTNMKFQPKFSAWSDGTVGITRGNEHWDMGVKIK